MKVLRTLSCLLCCLLVATAAQQSSKRTDRASRSSPSPNRPPKIDSIAVDASPVDRPCPHWSGSKWVEESLVVRVTTRASDPDGDPLEYQYLVTDGEIVGNGTAVTWDLTGKPPGTNEVKVLVSDQRGGLASSSTTLTIVDQFCEPCPVLSVSAPDKVTEGDVVEFSASVGGATIKEILFGWSVSEGEIIFGQGTSSIRVSTTGIGDKEIVATVEFNGSLPECKRAAQASVQVLRK